MHGTRKIEDFKRGMEGIRVENNQVKVMRSGTYTFYVSDYAGNERIFVHEVKEDNEPPTIITSYGVSEDYKTRK